MPARKPYTRYPWRAWLKPGTFTARRGSDFSCGCDEFIAMVRARTVGWPLKIAKVVVDGESVTVTIEDRATAPKYVEVQRVSDPFGAVA